MGGGSFKEQFWSCASALTGTNYKSWTFILKLSNYLHYPPGSSSRVRFGPGHQPQTKTIKTLKNWQKLRKLSHKNFLSLPAIFVSSVLRTFCRLPSHFGRRRELSFSSFQYRFSQICLDLKSLCPDLYVGNSSLYCFLGQKPASARMSNPNQE